MKNKIVVYKRNFKYDVFTHDVQPDIAKAKIAGGSLIIEPLIDWSGVGFSFPVVKGFEYTIKFKMNPKTTASVDQFKITASDVMAQSEADLVHYPADITQEGVYEFKYKKDYYSLVKFYYKYVNRPQQASLQHEFSIDWIEISVEDPNIDFDKINSVTQPFILENLKTNFTETAIALLGDDLANNHSINLERLDKLYSIEDVFTKVNAIDFSGTLEQDLLNLNLEI